MKNLLIVIHCFFVLIASGGCLSMGNKSTQLVSLSGNFSKMEFRIPLRGQLQQPLLPDRSWKSGEYFEFNVLSSRGEVIVRIYYEFRKHDYFEVKDVQAELAKKLTVLRESFIEPKGRLVELFSLGDELIPIFAFEGVANQSLSATVPVSGNYEATVCLMSEHAYNDLELLKAIKVILGSLNVSVNKA
jgi:hypothetical protein